MAERTLKEYATPSTEEPQAIIVDVKNGRIVFQVSDEMVGFELENVMKGPALYSCCMINDHDVKERFLASSTQYDLFDPF